MLLNVSSETLSTAGVLLLAIVAVEWGGYYMLSLVQGKPATLQLAASPPGTPQACWSSSLVAHCTLTPAGMGDPFIACA
jgi:hypothetical protein